MSENVAATDEIESPEGAADEAEQPTTPSAEDLATLKKRLAGKDQAYTKLKAEAEALRLERESLSKWKAEKEQADLTEVERLELRAVAAEKAAAEAEARAERIRLASEYPLAVEAFGDDPLPSEERLAALQKRLAATSATDEDEEPPRIDPNNPRRPSRGGEKPLDQQTGDEIAENLKKMGNPFKGLGWG